LLADGDKEAPQWSQFIDFHGLVLCGRP